MRNYFRDIFRFEGKTEEGDVARRDRFLLLFLTLFGLGVLVFVFFRSPSVTPVDISSETEMNNRNTGVVLAEGKAVNQVGPTQKEAPISFGRDARTGHEPEQGTAHIQVHVAGAVVAPGRRRLLAGKRVGDALLAAGGARSDADLERVNLAALLWDGERVYVPRKDQAQIPIVVTETPQASVPEAGSPTSHFPLNINTASAEELTRLPGIGSSIAAKIVEHRTTYGPFQELQDLLTVPGIGASKLVGMTNKITV